MSETEVIYEALEGEESATAAELASKTGISTMKVCSALSYLKSSGRAFMIGVKPISASREVFVYSVKEKIKTTVKIEKQTWFSPLLQ